MSYVQGDYNADTLTALKSLGYKLSATIVGRFMSPWMAGVNPYTLSRFSAEQANSWHVDTLLNGGILRGQAMFTYMHTPVEGGSTSNTYPGATSFYTDHLKRWCDLVKSHEEANRVIVCTGEEYFKLCGIDPLIDTFTE
jgi:peptidoglycan/xylan/chitin deacetylase (PgdA/CDA1 family)